MGVVDAPIYPESQIDTLPFTSSHHPVSLFSRIVWDVLRGEFTLEMEYVRSETVVSREVGGDTLHLPPAGLPIEISMGHAPLSVLLSLGAGFRERAARQYRGFSAGSSRSLPIFLQSKWKVRAGPGAFSYELDDAPVMLRGGAAEAVRDGKNSRNGEREFGVKQAGQPRE